MRWLIKKIQLRSLLLLFERTAAASQLKQVKRHDNRKDISFSFIFGSEKLNLCFRTRQDIVGYLAERWNFKLISARFFLPSSWWRWSEHFFFGRFECTLIIKRYRKKSHWSILLLTTCIIDWKNVFCEHFREYYGDKMERLHQFSRCAKYKVSLSCRWNRKNCKNRNLFFCFVQSRREQPKQPSFVDSFWPQKLTL